MVGLDLHQVEGAAEIELDKHLRLVERGAVQKSGRASWNLQDAPHRVTGRWILELPLEHHGAFHHDDTVFSLVEHSILLLFRPGLVIGEEGMDVKGP